jgi:hypothetical protein
LHPVYDRRGTRLRNDVPEDYLAGFPIDIQRTTGEEIYPVSLVFSERIVNENIGDA